MKEISILRTAIYTLLFLMPPTLGSVRGFIFITSFVFIVFLILNRSKFGKINFGYKVLSLGLLVLILTISMRVHDKYMLAAGRDRNVITSFMDYERVLQYESGYQKYNVVGRYDSIRIAAYLMSESFLRSIFGYGIGATLSKGSFAENAFSDSYGDNIAKTQIPKILIEIGVIGFIIIIFLFFKIYRYIKALKNTTPEYEFYFYLYRLLLIYMILLSFYSPTLSSPVFSAIIWIFSGVAVKLRYSLSQSIENKNLYK
ncbi:MAG: hypothetical protein GF353_25545 [Candidatus Lokiarchaeota archaeon]|nr:hypothetical protein [Candidatus Lokiarchaeota archaeon]